MDTNFNRVLQIAIGWIDEVADVTGVGQGKTEDGRDAIIVFASSADVKNQISESLEGVPVLFRITDRFEAQ